MNPYQVSTPTPIDLVELARFNHGVQRSKREYYTSQHANCYQCGRFVRSDSGLCATCKEEES